MTAGLVPATLVLGNEANFSLAIMSLFGWIVPQISIEIGEYHRALSKSRLWSNEEDQATGRRTIRNASFLANAVAFVVIVGGACAVALTSANLEPRMVSIIIGLSRLVGAAFIFSLSWYFPEWLEVYHVRSRKSVLPVTRSVRALRFNVIWSVLRQHLRVYFFFLPFCCGASNGTVTVAAVTGVAIGILIDVLIYVGKEKLKTGKKKMWLIFAMISVAVICSGVLFASGCSYVYYVWGSKEQENVATVVVSSLFAWLIPGTIIHVMLWRLTRKNVREMLEGSGTGATSVRQLAKSHKYKNPIGKAIVTEAPKAIDETMDLAKTAVRNIKNSANKKASTETNDSQSNDGEEEEEPASKVVGFADEEVGEETEEAQEMAQDPDQGAMLAEEEETAAAYDDGKVEDPTLCQLCKAKCCCLGGTARCFCCDPEITPKAKAISCARWFIWSLLSIFSLFIVVVNSGATSEQDLTRARLPLVQKKLYTTWMEEEVCAYDGDGTEGSLNENSTITTFVNKEAAHEAGFLVLHCGKCAHCSTWPNVAIQYTSRDFLAQASRRCGMRAVFSGGGRDYNHQCHMDEPINFDNECATCWLETTMCAKKYCLFIGVQAFFINQFTNMAVTADGTTATACNEANCEAWEFPNNFADCSGASRRKMNIQNTIRRPDSQMCLIVDVDWAVLFPGQ